MPLLVKYSEDYADEFQVSGFQVFDETDWNKHVAEVRLCAHWPQSRYFGTNEGMEWSSAQDYLNNFTEVQITDEEADFLARTFVNYGDTGHFLMIDEFSEPSPLY